MPLKSLELVGYKTFASKTTFEFSDSITAVVGPNGSGKSNIADSLRWVLGEQSYSLLRGKKTADMIFAGSEGRPRAGMASVTVTFDNSDGWLPIDFSEVAITRRAYRDGQNEYLINGQRVRLRDTVELLAHSGLAERTYTIIGQGLVDAALSLKAEERRKLFEEAAGIGVYRSRREEAVKRLETTRRNLERVQDILAELKPRLASLDRQARRAQEYEQVKTDLQVLLREWYGYYWHRQQVELASARELARGQETQLASARVRQSTFDQQMQQLRARIHHLRGSLNSWHRELSGMHSRRERQSRELAVAQERQRALTERRSALAAEQGRLSEELGLQAERLARAEQDAEKLDRHVAEAHEANIEAQLALTSRQKERAETLQQVQGQEQWLAEAASKAAGLSARIEESRSRIEYLGAIRAELEANLAMAETELGQGVEAQAAAQRGLEQAVAGSRLAAEALEAFTATQHALQARRSAAQEAIQQQDTELARLEAQLEVLRQAEQALAGYSGGSRLLLQAAKTGEIEGVLAAVSSKIDVPPDYEVAAAAALGQFLDAVILTRRSQAGLALDLLIRGQANGAVLPVDMIAAEPIAEPPDSPGVIGTLSSHVSCPIELRPLVDHLLGRTILVRDRAAAAKLRSSGATLVTLQGELFHAGGEISLGGRGTTGLISRSRQQREIKDRSEEIRSRIDGLNHELAEIHQNIAEAMEEEARMQQRLDEARQAAEAARSAVSAAAAALEQRQTRLNWQRSQLANATTEMEHAVAGLHAAETEHVELDARIAEGRKQIQGLRGLLHDLSVEEMQAQASHWHTRLAVVEKAAEDAAARTEDRRLGLAQTTARLDELNRQLEELQQELGELASDQEKLRHEEMEIAGQIAEAQRLIDPAEADLKALEDQQDSLQQTDAAARQTLSMAERNHAQAQISLARKQEALDSLRQRIEDDFGLVAFEYADEVSGPNPLPFGDLVESLPKVEEIALELEDSIKRQRAQLRRMGAINPDAQREHREVKERFEFLTAQVMDLNQAELDIQETIGELDVLMEREFRKTFDEVAREFRETFTRLFGGGTARLVLTNPEDMTNTGVDIEARLPGRRAQGLSLLSGGERSLTATALVFSLIRVSPTPFCVLDEVDAMLDEANVNRLAELLRELSERTQFIIITHNRNTVQAAETIYGITMGRDSTSQVLGLKLDEIADLA